jgi:hypothetical protein
LTDSGVEHAEHKQPGPVPLPPCVLRAAFYSQLKSKVGKILSKTAVRSTNLNIFSLTHTHPSLLVCSPWSVLSLDQSRTQRDSFENVVTYIRLDDSNLPQHVPYNNRRVSGSGLGHTRWIGIHKEREYLLCVYDNGWRVIYT